MSKKRDDLKERLKALRVNEPLKLSGEMKPPAERKEVPHSEVPPVLSSQKEDAQIEHTQFESSLSIELQKQRSNGRNSEPPKSEDAQVKPPQNEFTRHERRSPEAPRNEPSRMEDTKTAHTQEEVAQNGCAEIEHAQEEAPHDQPPQNEEANGDLFEPRSNSGFFKLSHAVFAEPLLQQLSGDCFRLFLWLSSRAWRFSKSNGQVRASVRFIEEQTGMSHATVSRALKTLKEKGLIRLVEVDFKRGNIWQVSALALGSRGPEHTPPNGERPQSEVAQIENASHSKRGTSNLKTSTKLPQNERNIRSIKNQKDLKKDPVVAVEDCDLEEREQAFECFESEVSPTDKKILIQRFSEKEFPHGFLPPAAVIRAMTALSWYRRELQIAVAS